MAVQQNKPTRSKRGMRRSHDALTAVTSLSVDKTSGEQHLPSPGKSGLPHRSLAGAAVHRGQAGPHLCSRRRPLQPSVHRPDFRALFLLRDLHRPRQSLHYRPAL